MFSVANVSRIRYTATMWVIKVFRTIDVNETVKTRRRQQCETVDVFTVERDLETN